MRWEIQCKALRRREKSRRRRNRGEQWKKQGAEQWKQAEIRARADASPGHIDTPHKESPAAERRRAHTSKTRISAIAHPSAERTLKSAPVGPVGLSKTPAIRPHMRSPCPCGGGCPISVQAGERTQPLHAQASAAAIAHPLPRQTRT